MTEREVLKRLRFRRAGVLPLCSLWGHAGHLSVCIWCRSIPPKAAPGESGAERGEVPAGGV